MNTLKCWPAVLIAVLLLPKVAASADDASNEAYEKGKACLDKKDYDAAIVAFTEAIRLDSEFAAAYRKRGWAYISRGQHDKAIADYCQAIRLNANDNDAYRWRGEEMPASVRRMAKFLLAIVEAVTPRCPTIGHNTGICCLKRDCKGSILASLQAADSRITWWCPLCEQYGVISGWRGTQWDRTTADASAEPKAVAKYTPRKASILLSSVTTASAFSSACSESVRPPSLLSGEGPPSH